MKLVLFLSGAVAIFAVCYGQINVPKPAGDALTQAMNIYSTPDGKCQVPYCQCTLNAPVVGEFFTSVCTIDAPCNHNATGTCNFVNKGCRLSNRPLTDACKASTATVCRGNALTFVGAILKALTGLPDLGLPGLRDLVRSRLNATELNAYDQIISGAKVCLIP